MSFKPAIHLLSALLVAAVFATGIACENGRCNRYRSRYKPESLAAAVTPEPRRRATTVSFCQIQTQMKSGWSAIVTCYWMLGIFLLGIQS